MLPNRKSIFLRATAFAVAASCIIASVDARTARGGSGGGRSASAGGSHRTASAGSHKNASTHRTSTAARSGTTANRNVNRNATVNNVNVNRNVNVHGNGYGYGGGYHPVARAATVGAVAVTTAAVIGSTYHSLPSNCATVMRAGATYHHCGSAWYQSQNGEYIAVVQP